MCRLVAEGCASGGGQGLDGKLLHPVLLCFAKNALKINYIKKTTQNEDAGSVGKGVSILDREPVRPH